MVGPNQYHNAPANDSNSCILYSQTVGWHFNVVGQNHNYAIILHFHLPSSTQMNPVVIKVRVEFNCSAVPSHLYERNAIFYFCCFTFDLHNWNF